MKRTDSDEIATGIIKAEIISSPVWLVFYILTSLCKLAVRGIVFAILLPKRISHEIAWSKVEDNAAKSREEKEKKTQQTLLALKEENEQILITLRKKNQESIEASAKSIVKDPKYKRGLSKALEDFIANYEIVQKEKAHITEIANKVYLLGNKTIIDLNDCTCLQYQNPVQEKDFQERLQKYGAELETKTTIKLASGQIRTWK